VFGSDRKGLEKTGGADDFRWNVGDLGFGDLVLEGEGVEDKR
jgi:hypothetical protein